MSPPSLTVSTSTLAVTLSLQPTTSSTAFSLRYNGKMTGYGCSSGVGGGQRGHVSPSSVHGVGESPITGEGRRQWIFGMKLQVNVLAGDANANPSPNSPASTAAAAETKI
ncbi:hypothetical protein SDJN03_20282, partial [Cucurbita argyrosperma subsp. sororia]